MGYMMLVFDCVACGHRDTGNPDKVPSLRVSRGEDGKWQLDPKGEKEPLCRSCSSLINVRRTMAGDEPFPIPDDAYEPGGMTEGDI